MSRKKEIVEVNELAMETAGVEDAFMEDAAQKEEFDGMEEGLQKMRRRKSLKEFSWRNPGSSRTQAERISVETGKGKRPLLRRRQAAWQEALQNRRMSLRKRLLKNLSRQNLSAVPVKRKRQPIK